MFSRDDARQLRGSAPPLDCAAAAPESELPRSCLRHGRFFPLLRSAGSRACPGPGPGSSPPLVFFAKCAAIRRQSEYHCAPVAKPGFSSRNSVFVTIRCHNCLPRDSQIQYKIAGSNSEGCQGKDAPARISREKNRIAMAIHQFLDSRERYVRASRRYSKVVQ